MIQRKVIDYIYKQYRNRPSSPDQLNIPILFEKLPEEAGIELDDSNIIIGAIDPASPFHTIPVNHIHAILEFDEMLAIVLHSSIIFISKFDGSVNIHIKEMKRSFLDKILGTYPD